MQTLTGQVVRSVARIVNRSLTRWTPSRSRPRRLHTGWFTAETGFQTLYASVFDSHLPLLSSKITRCVDKMTYPG